MRRAGYGVKLFREFVRFARENGTYWIIPLALLLGFAAILVVAGQVSAPLIYTLF
jgi:Family of unknown function (DUF5989)